MSVANAITSLRLCTVLDWREYVEVGEPGRAGAAARSGRRLRADGLPQPRSAAAGGRGARGAERRGAGAGWRCKAVESARQAAARGSLADRGRPRRLSPDRPRPRATSKPTSAIARRSGRALRRLALAHATLALSRLRSRSSTALLRGGRPSGPSAWRDPWPMLAVALALLADPAQRDRDRVRAARSSPGDSALAGCRGSSSPTACPENARTMVVVPTLLDEPRRRRGAARASRGARSGQPRSAHPLRDPQRLRRRASRDAGRGRRDPVGRARRHRGSQPAVRRRARRSVLPLPPRAALERARAGRGWDGSASAASSRSSTGCCAARPTRASRRRSASSTCCRRALLHHARLRHAAAARRREAADRHHRASAEPAAASTREPAASPTATASCSRASA